MSAKQDADFALHAEHKAGLNSHQTGGLTMIKILVLIVSGWSYHDGDCPPPVWMTHSHEPITPWTNPQERKLWRFDHGYPWGDWPLGECCRVTCGCQQMSNISIAVAGSLPIVNQPLKAVLNGKNHHLCSVGCHTLPCLTNHHWNHGHTNHH